MEDEPNPYSPDFTPEITPSRQKRPARGKSLSAFDRFCAVLAFVLAIVLLLLGALGLFFGCKANFSLPPVFGVIPAFVGWGIMRAVMVAWDSPARR